MSRRSGRAGARTERGDPGTRLLSVSRRGTPDRTVTSIRPIALLLALSAVAALALGAGGYEPDLGAGTGVDGTVGNERAASGGGVAAGGGNGGTALGLPSLGDGLGGVAGERSPSRPLVGAVLIAVGGVLVLVGLLRDDPSAPASTGRTDATVSAREEPGRTYAGTGSNEITRAWTELRRRVDDDPCRTPGELAREAIDREQPAEAVETLTDLFETVRYGDGEPTADRERRARAAADRLGGSDRLSGEDG